MTAAVVIVAAGKGERFGNAGKVMATLLNKPVLEYSIDAFEQSESISEIVLVAGEHTELAMQHLASSGNWTKITHVVRGGASRQESTANGVDAVSLNADVILVHDGARPLIQPVQIEACVTAAREHGGAIVAAPVTDTIKRVANEQIEVTIDRSDLWAAQTPQGFRADTLRRMMRDAARSSKLVTDEASLAELSGQSVWIVPGDASNLKITHPIDLVIAEAVLRSRKEHS